MKNIAKLGAVLVTAVTLLATSVWADPGKGKSEQWVYGSMDVWPWYEPAPCLDDWITVTGTFRWRYDIHTTPNGVKSFKDEIIMEDGDLVVTVEGTGKQYFLKGMMCGKESGQGARDDSGYGGAQGVNNAHMIFVAEDGDRLVWQGIWKWEGTGDPLNPRIITKWTAEWVCH